MGKYLSGKGRVRKGTVSVGGGGVRLEWGRICDGDGSSGGNGEKEQRG